MNENEGYDSDPYKEFIDGIVKNAPPAPFTVLHGSDGEDYIKIRELKDLIQASIDMMEHVGEDENFMEEVRENMDPDDPRFQMVCCALQGSFARFKASIDQLELKSEGEQIAAQALKANETEEDKKVFERFDGIVGNDEEIYKKLIESTPPIPVPTKTFINVDTNEKTIYVSLDELVLFIKDGSQTCERVMGTAQSPVLKRVMNLLKYSYLRMAKGFERLKEFVEENGDYTKDRKDVSRFGSPFKL